MDMGMLIIKALVLGCIVTAVLGFVLIKFLSKSTEGAVSRLNNETEQVRAKQSELNTKIKEANEELVKRRAEADELVAKMKTAAEEKAKEEREKIVKKARQDSEEIISKAQQTKTDIRSVLEQEMHLKAVDFAVLVLEQILSEKMMGELGSSMIDDFLKSLEEVEMDMIPAEVATIDVVTAQEFKDEFRTKLLDIVSKKLNRAVKINASKDEKIIGGIVLRFGSLCLDGSLRHILEDTGVDVKEKLEKGLL